MSTFFICFYFAAQKSKRKIYPCLIKNQLFDILCFIPFIHSFLVVFIIFCCSFLHHPQTGEMLFLVFCCCILFAFVVASVFFMVLPFGLSELKMTQDIPHPLPATIIIHPYIYKSLSEANSNCRTPELLF